MISLESGLIMNLDARITSQDRNCNLVSLAIVSDSSAYFYAEFNDYYGDDKSIGFTNLIWNDKESFSDRGDFYTGGLGNHPLASGAKARCNILVKGDRQTIRKELINWLYHEWSNCSFSKIRFVASNPLYKMMLVNELIGNIDDENTITMIDKFYIDLDTLFILKGMTPELNRENFIGEHIVNALRDWRPFKEWGSVSRETTLWKAAINTWCMYELLKPKGV